MSAPEHPAGFLRRAISIGSHIIPKSQSPCWQSASGRHSARTFALPSRHQPKTTVFLPSRSADSSKRRSFWQICARKRQNDGHFIKSAGGNTEKTVFLPNPLADSPKRPSFCQIRWRKRQNDGLFIKSARGNAETTVILPNPPAKKAEKPAFSSKTSDLLGFSQISPNSQLTTRDLCKSCSVEAVPRLRLRKISSSGHRPDTTSRGARLLQRSQLLT